MNGNDEIAQVIQLEVEGTKILVKATMEVGAKLLQIAKTLIGDKLWNAIEHRPGERKMKDIFKISEGGAPDTFSNLPSDMKSTIEDALNKDKIPFSILPSFDKDSDFSVTIPHQYASRVQAIVKEALKEPLSAAQRALDSYDVQIRELDEKIFELPPGDERTALATQRENIMQAKSELKETMDRTKDIYNKAPLTFTEYIKTMQGTPLEENQTATLNALENGIVPTRKFSAEECFRPARDSRSVPPSKLTIYLPDTGCTVTRQYKQDKDGLIYSNYTVTNNNGEIYNATDRDKSYTAWTEHDLPALLAFAGIEKNTQCCVFNSQQTFDRYMDYQQEQARTVHLDNGKSWSFSSEEVKDEALKAAENAVKSMAFSKINSSDVSLSADLKDFAAHDGTMTLTVNDIISLAFPTVEKDNATAENGIGTVKMAPDTPVKVVQNEQEIRSITAKEAAGLIDKAREAKQESIFKDFSATKTK